jgi:glycosyltransferase involved in cell wall biosynthesis
MILKNLSESDLIDFYNKFDWEMYVYNYPHLKNDFETKDKAWEHFINIGEKEGYIYFDINQREERKQKFNSFDWETYVYNYPHLKDFDNVHKAWWHFINIGEKEGYIYFDINQREERKQKFNSFDWEMYVYNYPHLKDFDNVHKAWWHFINIGEKEGYIYFDINQREERKQKFNSFDWDFYTDIYPDLKQKFDNKHKAWWHFINIGEKEGYVYFDINQHEENMKKFNSFDWEMYLDNYPHLKNEFDTKCKAWLHFINIGEKEGYKYFDNKWNILLDRKSIFYYVEKTCTLDFNTGIQRVTRNLSSMIGNYFTEFNLFLVIYDKEINDLRLLNNNELTTFCKYNGYNHLEFFDHTTKNKLFQLIKQNSLKITLFIPELFDTNQYDLIEKIIKNSKKQNYKTAHIYHDDTIYNNVDMDENVRKNIFETYIKIISNIDIILPNSNYSKSTYLFHKNRLHINTSQLVEAVPLSGELLNLKRIINKKNFNNYIFANISVTRRKNADTLIKAFNLLKQDYPELRLIICGVVYQENDYYNTFKDYLNENIIFNSNKTDEEIGELYKNALFSVYPSIEEGFGLPIYESLWYCTPVICHNATSTLEIANEINSSGVACIDCLNIEDLYLQMKNWMNIKELIDICKEIKNIKIKTWYEYTNEIIKHCNEIKQQNKIYYYVDNTCQTNIRTGIQIVTIYLAKQFVKKNINVVFVKWNEQKCALVPCNHLETHHLFNFNETEDFIDPVYYHNYLEPIHINNTNVANDIFFNPEFTDQSYASKIMNYLNKHQIKSITILYDIIALVLPDYHTVKEKFNTYFIKNILTSNKIITISEFTKTEFIDYCRKEKLFNGCQFPLVKSILLPYQYRNKNRIFYSEADKNNGPITILLPGTLEARKQQYLFMKIFNKFIKLNPQINVEVISFGHCWVPMEKINKEIEISNGKIKYLGIIANEKLFELYKTASFSCFISYYEGFGFPISESLWHGTPVLTANFGSMNEIANYGGCYCIDVTKEDEIYNALEILIKNPEVLIRLKKEIEDTDFITCTWENYADKIYKEIMET